MNEYFLDYNQSLAAKELGFDEPCLKMSEHRKLCSEQEKIDGCQLHNLHCGYPYCTIDSAIVPIPLPLKIQFRKWARKEKGIASEIRRWSDIDQWYYMIHDNEVLQSWRWIEDTDYEKAEIDCINEIIEILKNKK